MERHAPDAEVALAIDRVLAAEREAAAAIGAARREAESLIEAARSERRRLLERARLRAARIHVATRQRTDRSLARLEASHAPPLRDLESLQGRAQLAVERLARRLVSADRGSVT
jgi:cell division septum initiation protein DivIVA